MISRCWSFSGAAEAPNMPVGSLMRLTMRFLKKSLPLFLTCVAFLLTVRIWRVWNDINLTGVNYLATPSPDEQSRTEAIIPSNYLGSLVKDHTITRASFVQPQIHRTKLLSTAVCPNSVFLLILVSTNVGNVDRRHLIRKTWGADYSIKTKWKTVFLLGKNSIDEEMRKAKSRNLRRHGAGRLP